MLHRVRRVARHPRWAALASALWALAILGVAAIGWLDHLSRQAGRAELAQLGASTGSLVLAVVSAATVGAVLASRRPAHPVGWLLLALGLSVVLDGVTTGYARYGVLARPGALPGAAYLAGFATGSFMLWLSCAGFVLLLTPTGSLPSPRWRWWARVAAAGPLLFLLSQVLLPGPFEPEYPGIDNPLAVPALAGAAAVAAVAGAAIVAAALIAAAGSLVVRFRRARGIERQQLRWLAFAAALASVALLVGVVAVVALADPVVQVALGGCVVLLPLATGAAILRYRLYDLDRIISRTVAYGLLTVLLGGGYAAVVLGLGRLLGRESPIVVAGATLAVAALFQPARRRIQGAVDRRFDRRRYDAARTIEGFSARLRQQVDLDTLTAELLAVVEGTVQPAWASLWLRTPQPAPGMRRQLGETQP